MSEAGRVLVVTNDFPPRRGGIESFVSSLCSSLPPDRVVVYTARMAGSAATDEALAYPVLRDRSTMLLPTRRVARAVRRAAAAHACDRVLFGAAAPLGLLAGPLRSAGATRIVAVTHGHEVWWSKVPGARRALRRIAGDVDVLTYVSEFCRAELTAALPSGAAAAMVRLSPGVDVEAFRPGLDGGAVRQRLGIAAGQPVVLAASRLVARKGHDVLLAAWPAVRSAHPDAVLLIAGDGPTRRRLQRRAGLPDLAGSVRFLPGTPFAGMPAVYAAADVFAIPCRTRLAGLEPEALGMVFLEAAACGLPVVVGDSGGAPETVRHGKTGYVVDPRDPVAVADRLQALLADPAAARAMGSRGREFVTTHYSADAAAGMVRDLLWVDG